MFTYLAPGIEQGIKESYIIISACLAPHTATIPSHPASWLKCLLSHLGVAGSSRVMTTFESHWQKYAAPVRLCMIEGTKQASSLDENVLL